MTLAAGPLVGLVSLLLGSASIPSYFLLSPALLCFACLLDIYYPAALVVQCVLLSSVRFYGSSSSSTTNLTHGQGKWLDR